MRRQWLRNWKTLTAVALIFLAAVALVAYWESGQECVRWSTRIENTDGAVYRIKVCAEYRPRLGDSAE